MGEIRMISSFTDELEKRNKIKEWAQGYDTDELELVLSEVRHELVRRLKLKYD